MNPPKTDTKVSDHDDGDHTQPINLVSARTVASTFPTTSHRSHIESHKPGLMTLYFRTPTPRPQSQNMGPITQVSSTQHFTAKQAQDFKNSNISSWTVIRMPSSEMAATTSNSGGTLSQGILPSALSGGSRHMVPASVNPVITGSGQSMASIIRSSHQVPPGGHVIHQSFSSHVPRGPAAVASISAAPKSAVATPILRTSHSTLSSSSMMPLHSPVRAKSPTLINRTSTPPVAGPTSLSQVVDLQKPTVSPHIGLGSRALEGVRSSHGSSITIAKPISISQPIVQHLHQVYDKGGLKTGNSIPAHQSGSDVPRTGSIMHLTAGQGGLRAAHVTSGIQPHQTLTVISAKSLMPANHSLALAAQRTGKPHSLSNPIVTSSSAVTSVGQSPRMPSTLNPSTIPVAKVYPQSPAISRSMGEVHDNSRGSTFTSQSVVSRPIATTAQNILVTEKPSESSPIRLTSLNKQQVAMSGTTPPTYMYHDQYPANLTMHPPTNQLRPISFSQHTPSTTAPHSTSAAPSPIQPINSVMVAVDSRHHIALHPSYGSKGNESPNANAYNNHTSPRPSILRKRTSEGISPVAKKNLTSSLSGSEPISPRPDICTNLNFSSVLSPKPNSEKQKDSMPSMVSMSSEILSNSSSNLIPPSAIKREINCETVNSDATHQDSLVEASPRKKPRKQLLATNELTETHSSEGDENHFEGKVTVKEEHIEEEEKPKCVTYYKRPSLSMLAAYRQSWKSRHNHFVRYSDVKPKEEKKATVNELANQKGILQQANGWKIYHLSAQMEEVMELEDCVYSRLSHLLEFVEKDPRNRNTSNSDEDRILNKLTDLIKGNLQRSKIVQEQVSESKQQAIKILEHKTNIIEMVNKYISRRPLKKKEKL